jgi:hypothetical protein
MGARLRRRTLVANQLRLQFVETLQSIQEFGGLADLQRHLQLNITGNRFG